MNLEHEIVALKSQVEILTKLVLELSKQQSKVEHHYHGYTPYIPPITTAINIPPNTVLPTTVTWSNNPRHGLPSTVAGCDSHRWM